MTTGETIHRDTIGSLFQRLRNVCTVVLKKHEIKIGGPGRIIEIDESCFAKVKHNRGKDMHTLTKRQVWLFGMICRVTNAIYLEIVPDRTGFTLLSRLHDHVLPYSRIFSDSWSSYSKITDAVENSVHRQLITTILV